MDQPASAATAAHASVTSTATALAEFQTCSCGSLFSRMRVGKIEARIAIELVGT